jgi:hypothetical protein
MGGDSNGATIFAQGEVTIPVDGNEHMVIDDTPSLPKDPIAHSTRSGLVQLRSPSKGKQVYHEVSPSYVSDSESNSEDDPVPPNLLPTTSRVIGDELVELVDLLSISVRICHTFIFA